MLSSRITPFPTRSSSVVLRSNAIWTRTRPHQVRTIAFGVWRAHYAFTPRDNKCHESHKKKHAEFKGAAWAEMMDGLRQKSQAAAKEDFVAYRRRFNDRYSHHLRPDALDIFSRARTHVFGKNRGSYGSEQRGSRRSSADEFSHEAFDKESYEARTPKFQETEYVYDPITSRKVRRMEQPQIKSHTGTVRNETENMPNAMNTMPSKVSPSKIFIPNGTFIFQKAADHISNLIKSGKNYDSVKRDILDYDALVTYGPCRVESTSSGTPRSDPVQEGLRAYDERVSYSPGYQDRYEGTGKANTTAKVYESMTDYDATANYEPGAFNAAKQDGISSNLKTEDSLRVYDDLTPYNSEIVSSSTEDGLKDYDDSTSYEPGSFNGKLPGDQEVEVDNGPEKYDDLKLYEPEVLNGKLPGEQIPAVDDGFGEYDSTTSYEPGEFNGKLETDQLPTETSSMSSIASTLGGSKEIDEPAASENGLRDYDHATSYEPGSFNRKLPNEEVSFKSQNGLEEYDSSNSYEAVEFNKSARANKFSPWARQPSSGNDKNTVNEDLESIDVSAIRSRLAARGSHIRDTDATAALGDVEKEFINGSSSQSLFARSSETERLETAMDRHTARKVGEGVLSSAKPATNADDGYSKIPTGLETSYDDERKLQNEADPYSRKPQGLETNFSDESALGAKFSAGATDLEAEIQKIYEDRYGTITPDHVQDPASVAEKSEEASLDVAAEEPTTYKILAYDAVMQSISSAETTSIVHDAENPLTPAEALLRLSNPAKFFPYFAPLQSEGYEIVAGAGDILVFRKVRAAQPVSINSQQPLIHNHTRNDTNPIDGMRPIAATGNFASPTGFVNYDSIHELPPHQSQEHHGFKSNIDVRREEPVFSGRSTWAESEPRTYRKKRSLAKRALAGGAMVGGGCYAIGVVAEYFQTGGADGKGPQGF